MRRVKITLPATVKNLGAGTGALGLALGLHVVIEISERRDHALIVETEGEGAGQYSIGLQHPVVLAMMRIFQQVERAPLGIHVRIINHIPLASGLGAEAAFLMGGLIGANNLIGNVYTREQLLQLAGQMAAPPINSAATLLGGLLTAMMDDDVLVYRALPVKAMPVIVVVPEIENYAARTRSVVPERVPGADAVHNLQHLPFLLEGLRLGDLPLIRRGLADRLQTPYLTPHLSGFGHVIELARRAGVTAWTLCDSGPALLLFAAGQQHALAEALVTAFENTGVDARSWVVPIDTQGVVVSVMQSS